jgi:2-methylaconitate cis-trans-isomerase PrpF
VLPTGRPRDRFVLAGGREIDVSIVDAGNPVVFCAASALGLTGPELPPAIESRAGVMETLEEIRSIAAEMLAIVSNRADATRISPGLPKVAFVAPRASYRTTAGDMLAADTHDIQARLLSMQTAHRSYAGGGGICTAVAARLPGTVVHECAASPAGDPDAVRIAHPAGVMDVRISLSGTGADPHVVSATVSRTARRIMSGAVWVPSELISQLPTTNFQLPR